MQKIYFYFIPFFLFLASNIFPQPDTLTILHVNDSHSTLEAIGARDANLKGTLGGVSRVATLVGMTKMTESNVLFLHAGDISIGDIFFNKNFHVPELQILDALGVDAMTLGNHEFDLGPLALLGSLQYAFPTATDAFPILTANVDFSDPTISGLEDYVDTYTVKEFGDLKIGIFGLTTPATNLLSNPYPAVVSEDIVNIAATMVGTLRTVENCDVVILLSHLGVNFDQLIVSYVPGINVIVGGHDHYMYEEPITMIDPMGGTTWIVQAKSNYMYAGKMKLVVDGVNVQLLDYQLIPIDTNIPQEPSVQGMVDYLITDIENFYSIPFYTQQMGYASSFFAEETKDLLALGVHDTPLGNLVADAFRFKTSTNVALQAGGSIALPLWEGAFTPGDLFRTNGYGFNLVNTLGFQLATFDLSGMDILTGLTFGLSEIELNDEFLLQVSGMEYTYDGTKPAEERLVSVNINGMPIDPAATYSVTTNEMVLGILDYIGIIPSNITILQGITEFQALSEYVMSQDNFIQPKTLGRVLNVGNREARSTVIGAGWMDSPQGSYQPNKLLCDKLFFEFHMMDRGFNYDPTGKVTIRYPQANFTFKSNVCNWLLLENQTATLRGKGKINNQGNFGFLLIVEDSPDKLRIVIWDKNDGDRIVYDNLNPQSIHGAIVMHNRCVFAKEGDDEILTTPIEFALEQNYPNPFNPSTIINYSIPEAGKVELKVCDILGNEVATLVDEYKTEGKYEVEFNSHSGEVRNLPTGRQGLTSGVYIYTLRTNNFVQTKKMILIK
ncbi:MAG: 5'-nucleotidase C-terminal domain-containing protein [Ignavibacteriaceae bacterium]|nr:5'-nucleotidase C-terminal domain-containing protein [Ignavibacteriaceae bacterium]